MNQANDKKRYDISVVVPLFNEEENIKILYPKLKDVLQNLDKDYQIIFVDDGGQDQTWNCLKEIHSHDEKVRIIKLKKNFGQTAALSAGIDYARGDIIILMDGDLQHDPKDIPIFLEKIRQGYDIVSGWRSKRKDAFWTRRVPSKMANWLMSRMCKIKIHDFGTTFKAYKKEAIKNVTLYGEFHRFIPVLAHRFGCSICEIPIRNSLRQKGRSNYNLGRTIGVFFDLIRINYLSKYLSRPLQFFGSFGLLVGLIGFGVFSYLVYVKYVYGMGLMTYRPPLFLLSIILILIGVQFLTLGLLGEMIVKLYHDLPSTKIYSVDEVYH